MLFGSPSINWSKRGVLAATRTCNEPAVAPGDGYGRVPGGWTRPYGGWAIGLSQADALAAGLEREGAVVGVRDVALEDAVPRTAADGLAAGDDVGAVAVLQVEVDRHGA